MIRLLNAYFPARTLFLGISEACLVVLAFICAAFARLGGTNAAVMLGYEQGYFKILVISISVVTCMYYFDLYDSSILSNWREVLIRLVQVLGAVCILLALLYYAYPPLELGRGIFAIGFAFVAVILFLWRRLFMALNGHPQFAERTLILGDGLVAESLVAELRTHPEFGIRVIGQLKGLDDSNATQVAISGNGRADVLLSSIKPYEPSRVIVALTERRGALPVEALLELKGSGVQIQDGTDLYEAITGKVHIDTLRASQLLFSSGLSISRLQSVYKRVSSVVLSVVGLILALPLMVLAALAIRLDSTGPVIFRQKRVGKDGNLFTLYKFRTMVDRADPDDNHRPAQITDPRFTRVGRLLRRTRIDELPQLLNILLGDMHFVGPRPFVPNQERECVERIPYYRQRWAIKPGATGWAQINRGYCATIEDNKDKLAYDLFYIKNFSIGLDFLILFRTIKILLLGQGSQ